MLWLIHDKDYSYRVIVKADSVTEALSKMHKWSETTKQNGEYWNSANVRWYADICDNEDVL